MGKYNYTYFLTISGVTKDNGSISLCKQKELPQFKYLVINEAKGFRKWNFCHIALPIVAESSENLTNLNNNLSKTIKSLRTLTEKLKLKSISIRQKYLWDIMKIDIKNIYKFVYSAN